MTYAEWRDALAALEQRQRDANAQRKAAEDAAPWNPGVFGLVPDDVKARPGWREGYRAYWTARDGIRRLHRAYPKHAQQAARDYRAERDARRKATTKTGAI